MTHTTKEELAARLRASADEVESFPHPSHCDHLHVAHALMREAADFIAAQPAPAMPQDDIPTAVVRHESGETVVGLLGDLVSQPAVGAQPLPAQQEGAVEYLPLSEDQIALGFALADVAPSDTPESIFEEGARWAERYITPPAPSEPAQPVERNNPLSALAIRFLVAAGHVTQEKADEAFSIACSCIEEEARRMDVSLPWVVREPAQPVPAVSKAWMIEFTPFPQPMWFTGSVVGEFTPDPNEAIRFPTKEAAEFFFSLLRVERPRRFFRADLSCYAITEHQWDAGCDSEAVHQHLDAAGAPREVAGKPLSIKSRVNSLASRVKPAQAGEPAVEELRLVPKPLIGKAALPVHSSQSFAPSVLKWHSFSSYCLGCDGRQCSLREMAIAALAKVHGTPVEPAGAQAGGADAVSLLALKQWLIEKGWWNKLPMSWFNALDDAIERPAPTTLAAIHEAKEKP